MATGLVCSACGVADGAEVRDSRAQPGGWRRRRVCACGHRFSTIELVIDDVGPGVVAERVRGSSPSGTALRVRPLAPADEALFEIRARVLKAVERELGG
jgi:hypothetical protein